MSGEFKGTAEKTVKRSGASLVMRLTARQIWRSIGYCIKLNIVLALIFVPVFFLYANSRASEALEIINSSEAAAETTRILGVEYWEADSRYGGIRIPWEVAERLGFPGDVLFIFESGDWHIIQDLKYILSIPTGSSKYLIMSVELSAVLEVLKICVYAILAMEFLMVFFGAFSIGRSTRKYLRPITDLAEATRMIKSMHNPAPAAIQELKLSGAINTLNMITEEHLDKRISIDDERVELKGLASAINAMLDRLDAAYQAQLRFVSDASHELRTPISVIQGYSNLLDRWGKKDEKALQESIDAIKSEAQGMEALVEQLLFLARSDNNTLNTDMRELDVSSLADEVLRETAMIDDKHLISGDIFEGLYIYGDGQLLKQALRVFVDNAIKYTPDGGRIRLSVTGADGEVRISVSDTGIGIVEGDIGRVFDRFFRADESRARKTGGTGLGLAIAKYIIDSHGGYIEVVSRQNIGTRITAALPGRKVITGTTASASNTPEENAETA